ncbi:MAG: acetyl-CoA hydrolase/transferase family protein [Hyphomicrobium sp.]
MISADEVSGLLRPGMTVYIAGLAGESNLFAEALAKSPERCAGIRFVGVWLPGFNRTDYAALHSDARATAFFVGPELRRSFAAGAIDFVPISYFNIFTYLRSSTIDLAFVHVSAPDADGRVSLGVANDFTPAILSKAATTVAHINPQMPRTFGASTLPLQDIDYAIEASCPLRGGDDTIDPTFRTIGSHLATLVQDGDTLEIGIGRVQSVLAGLLEKRDLSFHTGAITDPLLSLEKAGALASRDGAITTGVAWGTRALYDFVADQPRVHFAPVGWTHDIRNIAAIARFVAINSVVEVDLLGQANAEMIGGRQISSAGGLTDFMRGARLSQGGFSIIALAATAKGGAVSRIVPSLGPETVVSAARGDVDYIVSEHGIADLRYASVDARAEALIAIAAPQFRSDLHAAWRQRRTRM